MSTAAGPRGVTPAARVLVGAATATLPSGAVRERYRLEHLGELSALPTSDQVSYALGALMTSWSLRRAVLKEADMSAAPTRPSKPLLCRINLRHQWHTEHNQAGEAYRRCLKCGKDETGPAPSARRENPTPYF